LQTQLISSKNRHKSLRRKQREPKTKPVSLIVGIICQDGIVVSSDSQTTDECGMARTDATKIYQITLADNASGLIAIAGGVEWALQIIEIVETRALTTKLEHPRSFADLAEEANKTIKQRERRAFSRTSKEIKAHFAENRCVLMIANYFKGKPHIFTLTSDGLVSPTLLRNQLFTSIGNSYSVANYILKKFNLSEIMVGPAHVVASHVINEVIQAKDSTCYYPIQIGFVFPKEPDRESHAMLNDPFQSKNVLNKVIARTKHIETELSNQLLRVFLEVYEDLEQDTKRLREKCDGLAKKIEQLKNERAK
jgi:20S proteasome alpha/beta subunit